MNPMATSKADILKISRELIQQNGWAAVNIRAVAAACGVSVGCIYNYFGSKTELVSAAVESIWNDIFHHPEDKAVFQDTLSALHARSCPRLALRTTDNEQIKGMAAQVKNDLDALGFDVTIQTDTSPATYAAIDGGEAYDILLAPGDPSCFGADPDLLLNWWYGDNVWMQTRCPWKESAEWQKLHGLMDEALAAEGDEQQKKWNECFDIIADNAVLYPVVHVKTVSASWDDPSTAPNGEALDGFKGIGTTSMSFRGVATVKA